MVETHGYFFPKKQGKKTQITKKIDGKHFVLEKTFKEKPKAKKYAKQRRRIRNTRIIDTKSKIGKIWDVYVVKK